MSVSFCGGCACGAIRYECSAEPFFRKLLLPRLSALQRQCFCRAPIRTDGQFHPDKWLTQILPGDRDRRVSIGPRLLS